MPQGSQYVVVAPPPGAVVATVPASCSVVFSGDTSYYNCGGAYYLQVSQGYQVVPPPIGATLYTLPNGAVAKTINGVTYYTFGGAYYKPYYSGGSIYYQIVQNPNQ
jgi:hypothetical protein